MGTTGGTSFVEVTNPGNPQVIGYIDGPDSLWRDMKTYGSYAYIVSEGGGGIQVVSLSDIDNGNVTLANTVTTGGGAATHNVAIDPVRGLLARCGGGSNGIRLYDLLQNEVTLREERSAALARPLDIDAIEAGLTKAIASVNEQYNHYLGLIDNLSSDESNLEAKIEKKKMELERGQRRLKSLLSVRPAFMDEYLKIEEELGHRYQAFVLPLLPASPHVAPSVSRVTYAAVGAASAASLSTLSAAAPMPTCPTVTMSAGSSVHVARIVKELSTSL